MSGVPATPRARTASLRGPSTPTGAPPPSTAGPSRAGAARLPSSNIVQASPHYTTTRRHSLYGTEDRVVIDPGSRIWKVGFSGEGRPRDVFRADPEQVGALWGLNRKMDGKEREEEEGLLEAKLASRMRGVFHESLMTDPKSRKVILVEHPLLPLYIKEMLARVLFRNLQVPSISFAPSALLSLLTTGKITGLVVDCGHLESTALPIFAARPLYPHLRTTPLAGSRLTSHLRALLLCFGTYLPPPTTLSAAVNLPISARSTRVPEEVLTDALLEEIKTRCCFVVEPLEPDAADARGAGVGAVERESEVDDLDLPPSSDSAMSESEFSRASTSMDVDSQSQSQSHAPSTAFSAISHSAPVPGLGQTRNYVEEMSTMYSRRSTASEVRIRVTPPLAQQTGTGRGTLIVPGWVRERAAELLFDGSDVDECSVAEVVLDSLLKVPIDLRKTMASSILVTGGTPMLPGFIARLYKELMRSLSPPSSTSHHHRQRSRAGRPPIPLTDKYATLRPLKQHFAILNNPTPPPAGSTAATNAGRAPAFTPASMAWVGGSLAGSLKTGGLEVPRERWDETDPDQHDPSTVDPLAREIGTSMVGRSVIPDWTRTHLPTGAPPVVQPPPAHSPMTPTAVPATAA